MTQTRAMVFRASACYPAALRPRGSHPFHMTTLRTLAAAVLATTFFLSAQEKPAPSAVPAEASSKSGQTGASPLVGVVDLAKAFDQYPKSIKMKSELDGMAKTFEDRIKSMSKAIDEMKGTIAVLGAESDERRQKEFEYELAIQQRQGLVKIMRERLDLEEMRLSLMVYEDLEQAITTVAKARGVALVLRVQDMGPPSTDLAKMPAKAVQGRFNAFERRQVWFASEQVDLTGDLIKLLMVPLAEKTGDKAGKPDDKAGSKTDGAGATPKGGGQ